MALFLHLHSYFRLHCLRRGAKYGAPPRNDERLVPSRKNHNLWEKLFDDISRGKDEIENIAKESDRIFLEPQKSTEQELVDAILDCLIYDKQEREALRVDPLVRLLIPNPAGNYEFTIVTAMGVVTDGKKGTEMECTLERLQKKRGVHYIRSDTATARSFEYNAERIIEAIEQAQEYKVPFGLIGYSQGCANALMAESLLYSGTPEQQELIKGNLACRQLLFSAANGSLHGAATDKKISRLILMFEEFVKYQQGYFSRALQSAFLETITAGLDSAQFHKLMGGANGFLVSLMQSVFVLGCHLKSNAFLPTYACFCAVLLETSTSLMVVEHSGERHRVFPMSQRVLYEESWKSTQHLKVGSKIQRCSALQCCNLFESTIY